MLTSLLKCVADTFQRHDITYVLTDGSLLGALREGAIIPWDADVDVAVAAADRGKLAALSEAWASSAAASCPGSWRLRATWRERTPERPAPDFRLESDVKQRVFPDLNYWADMELHAEDEFFAGRTPCKLSGVAAWCPAQSFAEAKLAELYGPDWRRPKYAWSEADKRWR